MIPCPSCHKPVEILDKHVGTLFTCPHCNAVYFIDFSGQPEMANHEEAEAPAYEVPTQDFNAGYNNEASGHTQTNYSNEQVPDQNYQAEQNYSSENNYQTDQQSYQEEAVEPTAEAGYASEQNYSSEQSYESPSEGESSNEEPAVEDSAYSESGQDPVFEETPFDFNKTLDQAPAQAPPPVSVSDSSDFSDVTDFANADSAVGPLTYVVVIDGIESSQLLYQLKEAMTDSRFGWDVQELLNTVGSGRMVLSGLTPAKASVLINRIKYLPFKISWRQDVLSSS